MSIERQGLCKRHFLSVEGTWIWLSSIYTIKQWIHVTCHLCGFLMFVYISHLLRRKFILCRWVSSFCKLMPLTLHYDQFYCLQMLVIKAPHSQKWFKDILHLKLFALSNTQPVQLEFMWLHSTSGEEWLKLCFNVLNTLIHSFHHKQFLKAQFRSLFCLW